MPEFSPDEMNERLVRIRAQMSGDGFGAFISTDPASIRYSTGFRGEPGTLLLTEKEVVLYTSFRTLPWARQQTQNIELSTNPNVLEEVKNRLGEATRIAVDSGIQHKRFIELQTNLSAHTVAVSSAIDTVRQVKSKAEIERLRESQRLNERVFSAILPQVRPGMSERAVQGLILAEIATREAIDGYSFTPIVAAGPNAWEIHHLPDMTPLHSGDMVILDLGVMHRGYASDMTRTICLGEYSNKMREVYDCVLQAQQAAITCIREGVTNHEVDAAARAVIEHAGHGRAFTHGLGHSIGLQTHDPGVRLSTKSPKFPLQAGMVFTIEPGIYLENEFGVRIEDTIVVTLNGYENLTEQSKTFSCISV